MLEKVSRIHETYLLDPQLFCWRHFSKTEVVQNTDLNNLALYWCFVSAFVIFCNNPSIYEVGPKIAVPDKEVQIVYIFVLFEFP